MTEWYNLAGDKDQLEITDLEGKVIYLFGFQSWCPGCHSHGFPAMKYFKKHYNGNDEVVFIAIQTVFEGFHANTAHNGLRDVEEFELDIPVAYDPGPDKKRSIVMRNYRSGGTPWTVIIDRNGIVRFNDFSIRPNQGIPLIDQLLSEKREG